MVKFDIPKWSTFENVLGFGFICGVAVVQLTLEAHEDATWRLLYMLFSPAMLLARYAPSSMVRHIGAVSAILLLVVGSIASPLGIEAIEEGFILIPLLYLLLYPGTIWAFVVALFLLVPYILGAEGELFAEVLEDSSELLLITLFASIMTYFQQRSHRLMLNYRQESRTDYLTHMENRLAYSDILKSLDRVEEADRTRHALLLIDVDNFKGVNDLLGHDYGDLLLKFFSQRLERIEGGRKFRIGGDEFAILLKETDELKAEDYADRILQSMDASYQLHGRSMDVGVSIGVARFGKKTTRTEQLVRDCDLALYQAKKTGKNKYVVFEQAMLEKRKVEDRLTRDIGQAIEQNQFFLVFQPKVEMSSKRIVGVEALVRWQHPEFGLISPADFIPIAESTRKIVPLGRWVLRQACFEAATWEARGYSLSLSVNVSTVQLEHDDMVANLQSVLKDSGLSAELLELEITETAMMENVDNIIPVLKEIRCLGVGLAVDDFGVAYSSLNQLTRLPLSVLKIDKSFVDNCHITPQDKVMVRVIIQMARSLGMNIVAEGVEQEQQSQVLLSEGCNVAQGFLYYHPLGGDEITMVVSSQEKGGQAKIVSSRRSVS